MAPPPRQPTNPIDQQVTPHRPLLQDREHPKILNLQEQCIHQHNEDGASIRTLLGVASVVAAIFTAHIMGGSIGICLGFAAFLLIGNTCKFVYNQIRNHDFINAAKALDAQNFRDYIQNRGVEPSLHNIVQIHLTYKQVLAAQTQPV